MVEKQVITVDLAAVYNTLKNNRRRIRTLAWEDWAGLADISGEHVEIETPTSVNETFRQ